MFGLESQIVAEGRAINRVFQARGVAAMTGPDRVLVGGQSVVLFGLRRRRSVGLREIAGLLPDVAAAVSSVRRCPVRVRLADDGAPVLEVPHPDPAPLRLPGGAWPAGRGALLGRCYGFGGARDLRVDLAVDPHLLIVAQTGGGKSSLLQLAALSLAWSASPADLRLLLIDHKRESLLPLADLPHVDSFSWRPAESAGALAWAAAEIDRRIAQGGTGPRVVVVIDELRAALADRAASAALDQIVSVGRALGVHCLAATQFVDFAGAIRANFTVRAVGPVVSAQAAVSAAGLPGSGAQYLPGAGAFVHVAGGAVARFQAYYLGADGVTAAVSATAERWRGVVAESLPVAEQAPGAVAAAGVDPAVLAAVAPVWRDGGSQAAMIRAAFGAGANTGGANRTRVLAAVAALEAGAVVG